MFQVCALGHHGWLFCTASTTVAVDPLLGARFAFTRELVVWPERALDASRFPRLDALFLTHEHEGHFDPFTLSLLPRDTPVWIPSRSSAAMQGAIEEMGFSVRRARAGAPIRIGDIEIFPIAGDHVTAGIEEWNLLAYTVRDLAGHGSFFSHVDLRLTDTMRACVLARLGRPGLLAFTGNEHQYTFQTSWRAPDHGAAATLARDMTEEHRWFEERGAAPAALLLVGGGWAFEGSLAYLNRNAFHVDLEGVARAVASLLPRARVAWARPGDVWSFIDGRLVEAAAPDIGVGPAPATSRSFVGDLLWLEDFPPACGRMTLTAAELDVLREELDRFAAALYAGQTFGPFTPSRRRILGIASQPSRWCCASTIKEAPTSSRTPLRIARLFRSTALRRPSATSPCTSAGPPTCTTTSLCASPKTRWPLDGAVRGTPRPTNFPSTSRGSSSSTRTHSGFPPGSSSSIASPVGVELLEAWSKRKVRAITPRARKALEVSADGLGATVPTEPCQRTIARLS